MNLANFILFVNSKCGISTIKYKGKFVKRGINAVTCRTNTSKKPGMRPVFACRRKKLQNIVNLAYRLAVFAAGPDRFLKACAFVSVFRHLFGNGLDLRGCQIAVGFCLRGQQFFLFFVERRLVDFLDRFLVVVVDVFKLVFRPVASMVFGAGVGRADENDGGNESGGPPVGKTFCS